MFTRTSMVQGKTSQFAADGAPLNMTGGYSRGLIYRGDSFILQPPMWVSECVPNDPRTYTYPMVPSYRADGLG